MTTIFTEIMDSPPLDYKEIIRYAGSNFKDTPTMELVDELLDELKNKLSYKVCYSFFPIKIEDKLCDLTFTKVKSKNLAEALFNCDECVIFAATLGMGIDRLIAKYKRQLPSRALILQAIGTERTESLCDAFCKKLSQQYCLKPRFSPGYGDLSLNIQTEIIEVLNCTKLLGITLNKSLIMTPAKSVTAIMGIKKT